MKTLVRGLLALGLAFAVCLPVAAHKASDAYLQIESGAQGMAVRVDVALRDLDVLLDLDADGDGRLTWAEVRSAWPAIEHEIRGGLQIAGCSLTPSGQGLERRNDGAYAVLHLRSDCRLGADPVIRYTLLAEADPTHRGIARIVRGDGAPQLRVLDPTRPAVIEATPAPSSFVREGIHHIVTGYDHVLFLLCLLLPAVMRREAGPDGRARWHPVPSLAAALAPVIGIVSAFTLAHSITLALAALKWVTLSPSFIEPAIAATIVLAALDNLKPIFPGPRALVTFAFGLIHGFGFAGVLGELNLPAGAFAWALLQFNLGIELGQLAIVLAATVVLYGLRGHRRYAAWAIAGGSMAAMLVGALWFIERTADMSLLPL